MLMTNTQAHRPVALSSPLEDGALIIKTMSGREELGRPFEYVVQLFSDQPQKVNYQDILGKKMTVRLGLGGDEYRYFNGHVSRFVQTGVDGLRVHYQATLVPWLWFLTHSADCRIFQDQTVLEIIKTVFRDFGFNHFEESVSGEHYLPLKYCVQYRETAFNFVSRLMEEAGIYYYFEHDKDIHTLVLSDSPSSHEPFPGYQQIRFLPANEGFSGSQFITDWSVEHRFQPGQVAMNDYNFEKPRVPLQAGRKTLTDVPGAERYEIFDYPGEYSEQAFVLPDGSSEVKLGEQYAKLRMEAIDAQYEVASGISDARGLGTGCTFNLAGHPIETQNQGYLVTTVSYQLDAGDFESGRVVENDPVFSCRFTAINALQPFRPMLNTPKPVVQGPQTAVVVGPAGEEIFTDKYGRIKVKFHWDRHSEANENSSCWIRVAQLSAGKKWGGLTIPRIGQEVMVEFLEGDPDQPIVTGCVYNADAIPPYQLPTHKTISTIKTNSSKGGQGFNEIQFEDKKGEEQIFIHSQKNMDVRVKNNQFETIQNDRHLIVQNDKFEHVENNRHEQIDADHVEKSVRIGTSRWRASKPSWWWVVIL